MLKFINETMSLFTMFGMKLDKYSSEESIVYVSMPESNSVKRISDEKLVLSFKRILQKSFPGVRVKYRIRKGDTWSTPLG